MNTLHGGSNAKSISVTAVITRADGTQVNLGTVGYYENESIQTGLVEDQEISKSLTGD